MKKKERDWIEDFAKKIGGEVIYIPIYKPESNQEGE